MLPGCLVMQYNLHGNRPGCLYDPQRGQSLLSGMIGNMLRDIFKITVHFSGMEIGRVKTSVRIS